jgi:predicted Fe-S protein YdhL (DUF1289 family)
MSDLPPLATPCIGVCEIDSESARCRGCLRSLDEIARWRTATNLERRRILARLRQRRRAAAPADGSP